MRFGDSRECIVRFTLIVDIVSKSVGSFLIERQLILYLALILESMGTFRIHVSKWKKPNVMHMVPNLEKNINWQLSFA
jgi:hypothetical protein